MIRKISRRQIVGVALGMVVVGLVAGALIYRRSRAERAGALVPGAPVASVADTSAGVGAATRTAISGQVRLSPEQQRAIGLKVEPVTLGTSSELVRAPGQVVPDETRYAFITPRAAGVVRTVAAHEGQRVKAGDLLATIDSPDVAQARFGLATALQELEVARSQADWQETIYQNTMALLERLEAGDSPEEIDKQFEDRPVGTSREQIIRAYANQRLARITFERNKELHEQRIIPAKQFQQVRAEYESADAALQSLIEQMTFTARLEHTRAKQALRRAETGTRVARARLRMLGVNPDGTVPRVRDGKVEGVKPDGTLEVAAGPEEPKPEAVLNPDGTPAVSDEDHDASDDESDNIKSGGMGKHPNPVEPIGSRHDADPIAGPSASESVISDKPVSTYPIWAPFDGTIIDRMMIVPGVYVDLTSRLFTMADLSSVWVEVHVHESNYHAIVGGHDPKVRFTSPAYPGKTFEAQVLYTGDVVDPKTRTLRLMARADNRYRMLKPGMFVEAEIQLPEGRQAVLVPSSGVLTEGADTLVFVQNSSGVFERRAVVTGETHDDRTEILNGLGPGERVVTAGAFKLKAELSLEQEEGGQSGSQSPANGTTLEAAR